MIYNITFIAAHTPEKFPISQQTNPIDYIRPIFCYCRDIILLPLFACVRYTVRSTSIFRANNIVKVSGVPDRSDVRG